MRTKDKKSMYLVTDSTPYELPLAVCGSVTELADLCHTTVPVICTIIRQGRTTRVFDRKTPAKIFKVIEDNNDSDFIEA
jgi:hypothetical protein